MRQFQSLAAIKQPSHMEILQKIKDKCDQSSLQTKLTTRQVELFDDGTEERTELFIQIPFEKENQNSFC
jgi:hypothetical protein